MATLPERERFDASALSLSDKAASPMATAHQSLKTSVESLQPEVATILLRLGAEFPVCLHQKFLKSMQVKKIEDDVEHVPKSARVKFEIKCCKSAEQDKECVSLVANTAAIVQNFQRDLRAKTLEASKLEVAAFQNAAVEKFAAHLSTTVKACFACESSTTANDTDKFINTLLHVCEGQSLVHCGMDANAFRAVCKRVHATAAAELPPPFVTSLPATADIEGEDTFVTGVTASPLAWLLSQLPKIWRTIETTFVTPWSVHTDVTKRNNVALELKKSNEEFFNTKVTDDAAVLADSKPPADPQVLNDLITAKVTEATRQMTNEISGLKKALSKKLNQDHSGADTKKSGKGGQAATTPKIHPTETKRTGTTCDAQRKTNLQYHPHATNRIRNEKTQDQNCLLPTTNEVTRLHGILWSFCQTQRRHCHVQDAIL